MRKKHSLLLVLTVSLFFAIFYVSLRADAANSGSPAGIAVVCIPDVIDQSSYVDQMQNGVNEQREAKIKQLDKFQADLQAIKADIETRKRGSDDYNRLKKDYLLKEAEMKVQRDMLQEELMGLQQKAMEQVYEKILKTVAKVAQQQGYELVLDKDKVEFPAASANEMTLTIQTHKVLYHADYMDITSEIIAELDK
ncbi:Outer membrane protein [Limihaloglobus sulfuriphilus]|uniref:Outer membrane protein n=1 Tax=Limihaloglobus sulfuriphilus TaxID=1851148 RepID=A0A1Q2MCX5_9BACT|nr:OmpH family outer membrane protein [Limihaloglobus sulfuriphilus]AQQ70102.1 Outer membrane protein [Limihaloglobus sulfuriphilus]